MSAVTLTLESLLFPSSPPLSFSVVDSIKKSEEEKLGPHPLDLCQDLGSALHVFAIHPDIKSLKNVKPKLRETSIIAFLLENPTCTTVDVCRFFNCGAGVVTAVMNSDMFKHQLSLAQEQLKVSREAFSLNQELLGGAQIAAEIVNKALVEKGDAEFALKAVGVFTKAMGMGGSGVTVNVNSGTATADMLKAARAENMIDITPVREGGGAERITASFFPSFPSLPSPSESEEELEALSRLSAPTQVNDRLSV